MNRSLSYTRSVDDPGSRPSAERETFMADQCRHGRAAVVDLIDVTWTISMTLRHAPVWKMSQYGARHDDDCWGDEVPGSAGMRVRQSEDGWPEGEEQPPEWFTEAARAFVADENAKIAEARR